MKGAMFMFGNTFTLQDPQGNTTVYDVLFSFEDAQTGKNYIVFTDNTRDELGNVQVFANTYDPTAENPVLHAIESEEEWEMLQSIMDQLMEETRRKAGNPPES
jgi:uncharacterized protein YrzB (UPF0473 family)